MNNATSTSRPPVWFWIVSGMGLLWSFGGAFQFFTQMTGTVESFAKQGYTAEQASAFLTSPAWTNLCFGIGVLCGALGCLLLLLCRKAALWPLLVAMISTVVMFFADWSMNYYTIFGTFMLGMSSFVALEGIGLWLLGLFAYRRGYLL